jgi:hypothetical protein
MKILKRVLKWFGILQIGWGTYREPIAQNKPKTFAPQSSLGSRLRAFPKEQLQVVPKRGLRSGVKDPQEPAECM